MGGLPPPNVARRRRRTTCRKGCKTGAYALVAGAFIPYVAATRRGTAMATLTRAHLSEAVYEQVGLSRNESASLVESVFTEIRNTLVAGQSVKISSFGSFYVREKGERMGRNPRTGEEVPILRRKVLVFRPSHVLKDRINRALSRGGV